MGMHKMPVTLLMPARQSPVLVQINCRYTRKINIPLIIPFHQLRVGSNRSSPRCQPKDGIGLYNHLRRYNIRRLARHILIIFCFYNLHTISPSIFAFYYFFFPTPGRQTYPISHILSLSGFTITTK